MSFTDLQIPHHSQNIIFQTENRKVDLYRFAKAIANLAIRLQNLVSLRTITYISWSSYSMEQRRATPLKIHFDGGSSVRRDKLVM